MNRNLKDVLIKQVFASCYDYVTLADKTPIINATDYAKMNGAEMLWWDCNVSTGVALHNDLTGFDRTALPEISVDLHFIDKLGSNKTYVKGRKHMVVFENLKFPRKKLEESDAKVLSEHKDSSNYYYQPVSPTDRHYLGHISKNGKLICNRAFTYQGQKFVYVQNETKKSTDRYSDGVAVSDPKDGWFALSPIEWEIANWDNLPKYINPAGNETEDFLKVVPSEAIIGAIPFAKKKCKHYELYQNSIPRAYFNDYNIHAELEKLNGNDMLRSPVNYDLKKQDGISFVEEVYDDSFVYKKVFGYQEPEIASVSGFEILTPAKAQQNMASQTQTSQPTTQSATQSTSTQSGNVASTAKTSKKSATKKQAGKKKVEKQKEEEVQEKEIVATPLKKENPFGVSVKRDKMKLKDQLKFYVETSTPFMLHGPSGVGKTRRVKELDPNLVALTLRDGILPEEVIGKTIYREGKTIQKEDGTVTVVEGGSFWDSPPWYKDLVKKCEAEPDRNHILFIDELSNVRPYEQSLVYHIVLEHSIDHNRGKLPKNCIVCAAGNERSDSEAAHSLAEPLFRRFGAHIYLNIDVTQFLEWGSERQSEHKGRQKIHPLVLAYIATHGKVALHSGYDPDKPPTSTSNLPIDPRAWEQVSDIIYDNGGELRMELIENKVGPAHAQGLIQLAENPPITLEAVLSGDYSASEIPRGFNDRYNLALSLRRANESQIETVREFIENYLGGEILATFDSLWVEDEPERALLIAELTGELDEEGIEIEDASEDDDSDELSEE